MNRLDTSWLDRLNAKRMEHPEVDAECRLCGSPIRTRDCFDPLCDACAERESPSAKLLQHRATIDLRPSILEAGEVPTLYRKPFVELAVWPRDAGYSGSLRNWPNLEAEEEPWMLTIYGDFETGKTQLAVELAVRLAVRTKKPMLFVKAAAVSSLSIEDPESYARILSVPILIVDDFGRGYSGNQGQAVQRLIVERYEWRRWTIVTTNLEREEFDDPSIANRLLAGLWVEMTSRNRGGE